MTKDEAIDYFISKKLLIKIKDDYVPLVENLINIKPEERCKNYPSIFFSLSSNKIYDLFMDDCNIPFKSTKNFVFLLRTKTKESLKILLDEILKNPDVDYVTLTNNIKSYYADDNVAKYPFSKFLIQGLWKGFITGKHTTSGTKPDNKFML